MSGFQQHAEKSDHFHAKVYGHCPAAPFIDEQQVGTLFHCQSDSLCLASVQLAGQRGGEALVVDGDLVTLIDASSALGAHFTNRLFNGSFVFGSWLWLGAAALQQGGALLRRQRLALAEDDGAFAEVNVQCVAGFEFGPGTQFVGR